MVRVNLGSGEVKKRESIVRRLEGNIRGEG